MIPQSLFGLVGYPLSHSFSQRYFTQKFLSLGLKNCCYKLFETKNESEILNLLQEKPNILGLNVTSPYKQSIIPYLDDIDPVAQEINAVNTIKVKEGKLIGYNTDYLGFKYSLEQNTDISKINQAVILGSGGASQSVAYVLKILNIPYLIVSRTKKDFNKNIHIIPYEDLNSMDYRDFSLIVNATPCGMYGKNENSIPNIDMEKINDKHIVFDLIYNPSPTLLLSLASKKGAKTIDGLQMLYSQAEYSWQIWNS